MVLITNQQSKQEIVAFQHRQVRRCVTSPQMIAEGRISLEILNDVSDLKTIEQI